jgi:hypothetical protein
VQASFVPNLWLLWINKELALSFHKNDVMKPSPIIQLIAIFFGMSAIYTSLSYLLSTGIFSIAGMVETGSFYGVGAGMYMLIIMIAMSFLGLFLIFKSNDIAAFITEKSGYSGELHIKTDTKDLLCIFIVFLALSELLKHTPYFLKDVLAFFTYNSNSGKGDLLDPYQEREKVNWLVNFSQMLFPILMIIFCRNLANYFGKNVDMEGGFQINEPEQINITKEEN